jgi:hypothetical protein
MVDKFNDASKVVEPMQTIAITVSPIPPEEMLIYNNFRSR